MKKVISTVSFRRIPILPCKGIILYLTVIVAAYVFAQLYRSPISAILLVFVIAFGLADILLFICAIPFVKAEKSGMNASYERKSVGTIRISLINRSIIPVSSAEAVFSFPTNDGMRYIEFGRKMPIPPFFSKNAELEVPFERRGSFEVGVCDVYLYDTLRLIRVRKRVNAKEKVTVLPQRYRMDEIFSKDDSSEDASAQLLELSTVPDYGDIREYRPGDSMKRIHWKLSTKSEELLVRKYTSETENSASVYCCVRKDELSRFEGINRLEAEDRVIECAYTVAVMASEKGYEGMMYLDGTTSVKFGTKNDDLKMSYFLSAYKGTLIDSSIHSDKAVSPCVCVFPFVSSENGSDMISDLKLFPAKSFTACVVELSDLINERERSRYSDELIAFVKAMSEMGINTRVLKGGNGYGGQNL